LSKKSPVKDFGPVLAYPFQITDLRQVKSRSGPGWHGRKRLFPGVKVRMMDSYVRELRACAEAIGWRFDAFLYHALLKAKRETERLFGVANGGLVTLSKSDRAELANHYQAVCEAGRKAQLSDYYHPQSVLAPGEPLAWAFRNGPPMDSN
jgi:hypothetical protein